MTCPHCWQPVTNSNDRESPGVSMKALHREINNMVDTS